MVLRSSSTPAADALQPAYEAFLPTQEGLATPPVFLLQSEHSRLAGALAQSLSPEVFGELSSEVIAAISDHDFGWDANDTKQLKAAREREPYSFTKATPEETLPCWFASIAKGRELGLLQGVLVSRHCCLLGTGSNEHASVIAEENARRKEIEQKLDCDTNDLQRWTAALGFCDLLSLYLCSGSQTTVMLPLAHPQDAAGARTVALQWTEGKLSFSEPIFTPGAAFAAQAMTYSATEDLSNSCLNWCTS